MAVRVLYTDVDGTLVGPLGNLFWDADRRFQLETARALGRAREAGLEIVPLSGRSRPQMGELARLVGAATWIGELGAIRSYEHGAHVELHQGDYPGEGLAIGALREIAARLVERSAGRLEEHAPWNAHRETSFMVRGELDVEEAGAWLAASGHGWAECLDNGVIPRRYDSLPDVERVRVYHLNPRGISKRAGVAADRARRGLAREECAVIGDARADLECAAEVGRAFAVRNALEKDPDLGALVDRVPGATVTERGYGLGVADTVDALLG